MHYPVLYYVLYLCGVKLYRARGAPLQLESLMVVSGVQRPTYLPAFPITNLSYRTLS